MVRRHKFELTLMCRKVTTSFPNVGHNLHKVEIQWTLL